MMSSSNPVAFNSSAELQAARINVTENNRSCQHQKHFQRMQKHAERIANNKIKQVQDRLEHIQNSSGALSEFKMPEEKHKPFFMYGRRTESRKMSKRIATLRYLHQQKQSKELEKLKLPSDVKGEECTLLKSDGNNNNNKSPDEIFQDILDKVDTETKQAQWKIEQNCVQSVSESEPVWVKREDFSPASSAKSKDKLNSDSESSSSSESGVICKHGNKERILRHPHTFPILNSPPLVSNYDDRLPNVSSLSLLDEQSKSQILYRKKYGIQGHKVQRQDICTCVVPTVSDITKYTCFYEYSKLTTNFNSKKPYVYTTHDKHHINCPYFNRYDNHEQPYRASSPQSTKSQLSFSSSVWSNQGSKAKMDIQQNGTSDSTKDKYTFRRPSIYAPTASSRQRSLCSLINRSTPPPRNFVL